MENTSAAEHTISKAFKMHNAITKIDEIINIMIFINMEGEKNNRCMDVARECVCMLTYLLSHCAAIFQTTHAIEFFSSLKTSNYIKNNIPPSSPPIPTIPS